MLLFVNITDLVKLYNSEHMNPDAGPQQLQAKVQFDIRFYFCRRGGENIHDMTKDTFQLFYDNEMNIGYVKKVKDEETKNHKETNAEIVTGFMPQILDPNNGGRPHKLCPVRSFENYIAALNPKINSLWQQPIKHMPPAATKVWYKAIPVGHNPLHNFMSKLAEKANLSQHYTNHCIRVTGASNLMRRFTPKQVMAVTGHKCIASLSVYQRVLENEKLNMGMSLIYSLLKPEEALWVKQQMEKQAAVEEENYPPLPAPQIPQQAIAAPPAILQQPILALPEPNQDENPQRQPLDPVNNNAPPVQHEVVPYVPTTK